MTSEKGKAEQYKERRKILNAVTEEATKWHGRWHSDHIQKNAEVRSRDTRHIV